LEIDTWKREEVFDLGIVLEKKRTITELALTNLKEKIADLFTL